MRKYRSNRSKSKSIKRKYSKRRMTKSYNKRKINTKRRRKTRTRSKGGALSCNLHPAPITQAYATTNQMTRPSAYYGENSQNENTNIEPTYWSNFDSQGAPLYGIFN